MTVRAKFRCDTKTESAYGHSVCLAPVYQSSPESENTKFWKATPSGKLEMSGLKKEVVDQFQVGKEYYIDITEAPQG